MTITNYHWRASLGDRRLFLSLPLLLLVSVAGELKHQRVGRKSIGVDLCVADDVDVDVVVIFIPFTGACL